MPILEATKKAERQAMTTCIRCPAVIPAGPPSIPHLNEGGGWTCSQACSDAADLEFHDESQVAIGALFAELTDQGLPQ